VLTRGDSNPRGECNGNAEPSRPKSIKGEPLDHERPGKWRRGEETGGREVVK